MCMERKVTKETKEFYGRETPLVELLSFISSDEVIDTGTIVISDYEIKIEWLRTETDEEMEQRLIELDAAKKLLKEQLGKLDK